jgi:hypothetical protein
LHERRARDAGCTSGARVTRAARAARAARGDGRSGLLPNQIAGAWGSTVVAT